MTDSSGGGLISVLSEDHRRLEGIARDYERGAFGERGPRDLVAHLITELVRHSVADERYVYPLVKQVLPDGEKLGEQEIQRLAGAERVMKTLEGLDSDAADFDRLTRELVAELREHVLWEGRDILPRLEDHCTPEQIRDVGEKVRQAKASAPTHPHPMLADKPPVTSVLDPGVGLIDKVRDAVTGG